MLDAVPLLATTLLLIFIFSYFFVSLQLSEIRANWNERRCDTFVIPIAHLVPDGSDPSIDPSEFAINNFQYCLGKLIDSSISTMMSPVLSMFNSQLEASGQIQTSINYLRANAKSLLEPLNALFQSLWNKIKVILYGVARIYAKLASSFNRIFGIAISSIFAGIGVYKGIRNLLNLVIYVIIVVITIIIVIILFAAFLIAPVLPITLIVLATISASVFGAPPGSDGLCVAPGTLVALKDGWKAVEQLKPGDELREGIIEGILTTVGGTCVNVHGVVLSESHVLFDTNDSKWKTAAKHSMAKPTESPQILYCLNTSTHRWIVKGDVELTLLDWDEIPDEYDVKWEQIVDSMLNPNCSTPLNSVPGRGLLGEHTYVLERSRGLIKITTVTIGDYIKDETSFTEVLGVYRDIVTPVPRSGVNKAGWIFDTKWVHPKHNNLEKEGNAYSLVTRSGVFSTDSGLVRDFTEVGADRIDKTYDFVLSLLASINRNDEAYNICN